MKRLLLTLLALVPVLSAQEKAKLNVLFICVDDLKPALGCYGDPLAKTPNLDRLAARGMRFDLAYCNQSVCAASRNNLLLGSRSTSLGIYDLGTNFRQAVPDAVTLPQYFMKHGYRAEAVGKILHTGHGNSDDKASWSVPTIVEKVVEYLDPKSTDGGKLTREEAFFTNQQLGRINELPKGAAWERSEVPDNGYADGRIADEGIKRLQAARERTGTPFFLALGFTKPHLPFTAPAKYWDMHDPAKFTLAKNPDVPKGAPPYAGKRGGEISNYEPIPDNGRVDDETARKLIHGYYAATSYMDAQLGRVLDELDRLKLSDNTIIVLWGDHGWHLGDHGIWTKHTNYEQANHIPLLIIAPGMKPGSTRQLAETVDIYPTLAELAGLPKPSGPQPIDGLSLVPVLNDPAVRIRDHATHCFPRGEGRIGRAIRTERYRLVEWKKPGTPSDEADFELYDYETAPDEPENLATQKPEVVKELRALLARQPEAEPRPIAKKNPKPNIILILADDLGWRDVGYNNAAGFFETPNIDRLCRDGTTFTDAYAGGANCVPSRACLLSGTYTPRHEMYAVGNTSRGPKNLFRLDPVPNRNELRPEIVTMAEALKAAGYATGHFGKWHLGSAATGTGPLQQGFDVSDPKLIPPPEKQGSHEDPKHAFAITRAACEFMEQHKEQPFFAYVAHHAIHAGLQARPATLQKFRDKKKSSETDVSPLYAACTYDLDDSIGLLLGKLGELGLDRNTLVIFTSDNGGTPKSPNEPLRGAKGAYYEGGIREPFVVRWPGVIPTESKCATPVIHQDLYPTFLAAAGAEIPSGLDGTSLLPLLKSAGPLPRDAIFWHFPGYLDVPVPRGRDKDFRTRPVTVIRKGDWKLLLYHEEWLLDGGREKLDSNRAVELYQLREDIGEHRELAGENKGKRDELLDELLAWMKKTDAKFAAIPRP